VISPLLYVPHNGPALPEKSAKIVICQQTKLSVCASSAAYTHSESLMQRWRLFKTGELVAMAHKIANVPRILKIWDIISLFSGKLVYAPFLGIF
jgi:hypothetical protein